MRRLVRKGVILLGLFIFVNGFLAVSPPNDAPRLAYVGLRPFVGWYVELIGPILIGLVLILLGKRIQVRQ